MRIGILTGGGDCPGLNAVIRAVVMHAHARGIEVLGVEDGLDGLLPETVGTVRRLTPDEVRRIVKMGDQTEQFCRQTALVLEQNQHVLPPTLDLADMKRDMAAYELLRPRLLRLKEILARVEDTQMALGSDIMVAASDGYALMKMFGKAEGLSALQESMAALRPGRRASKPKAG